MRYRLLIWILLVGLGLGLLPAQAASSAAPAQENGGVVVLVRFEGALHPVMVEHFKRAQTIAENEGAQAIILELDTPGGELNLMNTLVQQVRGSSTPVIVYIAPRGAMAGSAGTLLTLAGHLSAMAPETTIGAASPVGSSGEELDETMASKLKGITKATVRSLSTNRPPEAVKLAEEMIDTARAVSVDEAVEVGLVDLKASSVRDLLAQIDGRTVAFGDESRTLRTASAEVIQVPRTFMEELLTVLANPNIAFLLLAIGVQAILIEISSPGGWVAGFIGVVCLLLATYGLGLLPVNWFGLLFLVVAFVLFLLDIKAPTHGALTAAGVGSFIIGALVLFNSPNVPAFQRVSVPLVIGTGISIGLIFFVILGFALRAQRSPLRMSTSMVGQVGIVNTTLNPIGTVQLGSELWTATAEDGSPPLAKGERVEVTGQERLQIKVKRLRQ